MADAQHILVTGGAGMIGSNLVKRLIAIGHRVTVVDNLWRGKLAYLHIDGRPVIDLDKDFHALDLTQPGILDPLLAGVDYVYHLAEIVAGIDYVFNNQGSVFHHNILINSHTIASVRRHPPKGFIYVGSACSFPADKQTGVDAPPLREEDQYPAAPESGYGWSKLMGEYESFLLEAEAAIPVSVLSFHNVYGSPCDLSPERSQVIPALSRKVARFPTEPVCVWGSGEQGRAFVHVSDVVDALVLTLERGLGKGLIQIGPDVCTPIRAIAESLVEISGKDIDISYDLTKREGDRGRCADYSKARSVLGWEPRISLRDGLEELYAWTLANLGSV